MLKAGATIFGLEYDDDEWQEIGRACLDVQQKFNERLAEFLQEDPDLYKTVMGSLQKGNEAITKVVDSVLEEGLKKVGLKK